SARGRKRLDGWSEKSAGAVVVVRDCIACAWCEAFQTSNSAAWQPAQASVPMYFAGSSASAYGVAPTRLSTAIALAAIERSLAKCLSGFTLGSGRWQRRSSPLADLKARWLTSVQ